jgi:arylsulfatase A-like enzyme
VRGATTTSVRRPRAELGPLAVLFAGSGAVAGGIAAVNAALLAAGGDVARLRDLRLIAQLRTALDAHDIALFALLPRVMHAPFDLRALGGLAAFVALAVLVHLALFWIVAAVVAPVATAWAHRKACAGERWPRAYPVAVGAAAVLPVVAHRLGLWTQVGAIGSALAAALLLAGGAAALLRLVRGRAPFVQLARACAAVATVGVTLAALGAAGAVADAVRERAPRALPPPGAPNVLLISIDTLRPDHLGSYGYGRDTSPHLDALAAAGARFTTAVSPTSWTLPAHATLLTALPPEVHGVVVDGLKLDPSVTTLAEILQTRGYATAGFVSGPYLDAGYGFARGFDLYDDYSAVRISHPAVHRAHTTPALLRVSIDWLASWAAITRPRPFFLFVHMWDVHYDFNPPPPYDTMFDPEYRGTITGDEFENGTAVHAGMDARDLQHVVALYDGEIRYTDDAVGRLLDELRHHRVLDDTVVVVTSDHGEEFFEHGQKGHRNALYDESIRVPLIVRYPANVPAGAVVHRQVRLLDVAPTIFELTGTPPPAQFGLDASLAPYTGRSVVPLLSAGTEATQLAPAPAFADLEPQGLVAVRHEAQKLIVGPLVAPRDQLFDLVRDPGERTDLAAQDAAAAGVLRSEITAWHDTARLAARQARAVRMSDEHKAALRALGYLAD